MDFNRILRAERTRVAVLSLAATWLFFIEYLPPFKRVHLFSDIEGYHYPLLNFVFQILRSGRFPEWDSSIYCGLPLVGNVQAALFYPPNWVMFVLNTGRAHLSFKGLEIVLMAHIWLAFFLCYLWLRDRRLGAVASILGAAVFGFSGYMMSQNNHVGVITGCAWTPLALWGIDQAASRRDWRPLWKVVAASALCFLAGYPPTWIVLCVTIIVYAAVGRNSLRTAAGAFLALGISILVFMVQLLPSYEAAGLKAFEPKFGSGLKSWEFYVAYFVPNYFDLGSHMFGWGRPPGQYLYLGAPAMFGLLWLVLRRRDPRIYLQPLALAAVCLFTLTNPYQLAWKLVSLTRLTAQMCHSWNFLEGLSTAAALITALSIHDFLARGSRPAPRWLLPAGIAAIGIWSARQLWIWLPGGPDFTAGWSSAIDAAIMLCLFALALYVIRAENGKRRAFIMAALLVGVFIEYKTFGTSRGFDAREGDSDKFFAGSTYPGIPEKVYRAMLAHADYRVALDQGNAPWPVEVRHWGLSTPQGFDPFISEQYRALIGKYLSFNDHHQFYIGPENEPLFRLTGVRYFITRPGSPSFKVLTGNPNFRLLQPAEGFFVVFEYLKAEPPYRWDGPDGPNTVERITWHPGKREFKLSSATGGRFVLVEQFFPGWSAFVDGRPIPVSRWEGAFQAIEMPPGDHRVAFKFHSPGLRLGAAVSIVSIAALVLFSLRKRAFSTLEVDVHAESLY